MFDTFAMFVWYGVIGCSGVALVFVAVLFAKAGYHMWREDRGDRNG